MVKSYTMMIIHMDVDGTQIDREYINVVVSDTGDNAQNKRDAEEMAGQAADAQMPRYDSNSYLIIFIL